jgi:hypothetical protein
MKLARPFVRMGELILVAAKLRNREAKASTSLYCNPSSNSVTALM